MYNTGVLLSYYGICVVTCMCSGARIFMYDCTLTSICGGSYKHSMNKKHTLPWFINFVLPVQTVQVYQIIMKLFTEENSLFGKDLPLSNTM